MQSQLFSPRAEDEIFFISMPITARTAANWRGRKDLAPDRTPHLQRPVRETRRSRSRARNRSVARVWGWHGQLWAVRVDAPASDGLEGERAALFRRRRPWPVPRPDGNRGRAARRTSLIRGEACAPTELRAGQYGMAAATAAERGGITGPVVTFPPGAFPRRLLAPKGGRQRICR